MKRPLRTIVVWLSIFALFAAAEVAEAGPFVDFFRTLRRSIAHPEQKPGIMFVGHYSVAFAVKSERNKIPLWVLFVAVQLLDFLWAPLVLLGIEKVRIVPGITATNPLDLYYMPYTHSLVGALFWSGLAFAIYRMVSGRRLHAQQR